MAKIQLVYIPIGGGGSGAAHQFLLHTRDDGSRDVIRGGPERQGNAHAEIFSSHSTSQSAGTSFGAISVAHGEYKMGAPDHPEIDGPKGREFDQKRFDGWFKQDVASGAEHEVGPKWDEIKKNALEIDAKNIPYSPMTQNSNSLASESLRRSGIDAPSAQNGVPWGWTLGVMPWAPGADNRLGGGDREKAPADPSKSDFIETRHVGNLLASAKLFEASAILTGSPSRSSENPQFKRHDIGIGD